MKHNLSVYRLLIAIFCFIGDAGYILGQNVVMGNTPSKVLNSRINLLFWNVENLFNPTNNPNKNDDDFTPDGKRHWTSRRLNNKLHNISKVISASSESSPPAIIGLAEVEDDSVLLRLTRHAALRNIGYNYIITQSQDQRGINVALLYRPDIFNPINHTTHRIQLDSSEKQTRDILHILGLLHGDTLDIIVCHLPSRLGGTKSSNKRREKGQILLRQISDSIMAHRKRAKLIIMGDMNDEPSSDAFCRNLRLSTPPIKQSSMQHPETRDTNLYNCMLPLQHLIDNGKSVWGSYKYKGHWEYIDHFILNGALLPHLTEIRPICFDWMLTEDNTHTGHRPLRSYFGYHYEGGYSDHLPILLELEW